MRRKRWGFTPEMTVLKVLKERRVWDFLVVQWLGLRASTALSAGSIPGRGTKIPQATCHNQMKERERRVKRQVIRVGEGKEKKLMQKEEDKKTQGWWVSSSTDETWA